MDCNVEIPSLLTAALYKAAVLLWNHQEIKDLISTFSVEFGEWQDISEHVRKKASTVAAGLPFAIKKKLLNAVQRVSMEIRSWLLRHGENLDVDETVILDLYNKVWWAPNGTIDRKRTAEVLACDGTLDLGFRYRLSCFYCLETHIYDLWSKMDDDERSYENDLCDLNMYDRRLTTFWTYHLQGRVKRLEFDIHRYDPGNSPCAYAFQCAAQHVNVPAMQYFWEKMTQEEREKHLQLAQETGVVCFVITVMNKEQQLMIFKNWASKALEGLWFWPRLDLFVKMARCSWEHLSSSEFSDLLCTMTSGCAYDVEVFTLFWTEAPLIHKKYLVRDRYCAPPLLEKLLKSGDEDNFKLILKEASVEERENLIFGVIGISVCANFVAKQQWQSLKLFAGECLFTKHGISQLQDDIEDHLDHDPRQFTPQIMQSWEEYKPKFFRFIDSHVENKIQ